MANRHPRGRRPEPEPQDDSDGFDWDDVVDVVCVGQGPVSAAAAVAVAKRGLQVCRIRPAGDLGEQTAEYLRQVTDDVVPAESDDQTDSVPVRRIDVSEPVADESRPGVATFVGASLRTWAGQCINAVGGVLSTAVADPGTQVLSVGTVDFGTVTLSFDDWVAEQTRRYDVAPNPADVLVELIFDDGRVVGVLVETDVGIEMVRARRGVIMALREDVTTLSWPAGVEGDRAELAFVTRAASRFGRLELLIDNSANPDSLPR